MLLCIVVIETHWHSWLPTSCCGVDKNDIRRCLPSFVGGHDPHFILRPGIKTLHDHCSHIAPHTHDIPVAFSLSRVPHLHNKLIHRSENRYPPSSFSGKGPGQCDIPLIGTIDNLHIGWRSREIWVELVMLLTMKSVAWFSEFNVNVLSHDIVNNLNIPDLQIPDFAFCMLQLHVCIWYPVVPGLVYQARPSLTLQKSEKRV